MPSCPSCHSPLGSGDECRLYEALGCCFTCWPHRLFSLTAFLTGNMVEEDVQALLEHLGREGREDFQYD